MYVSHRISFMAKECEEISYVHKIAPFVHFQAMFSDLWFLYISELCFGCLFLPRWAGLQEKTPNFHGIVWNHEKLFHHIQLKPFGAFLTPGGLPNKSQVWPVTTLQDLVNPRRDRRLWWRERDRALAAHFFWSLLSSVPRVLLKTRVNSTFRWRWLFGQNDLEILVIYYVEFVETLSLMYWVQNHVQLEDSDG